MTTSTRAASAAKDSPAHRNLNLLFGLAVLLAGGILLSGCNTTAGAGQDINATGSAITHGAETVKSKL